MQHILSAFESESRNNDLAAALFGFFKNLCQPGKTVFDAPRTARPERRERNIDLV